MTIPTVKAGNVRLKKGGKIGSITAETAIMLIHETGAVLPAPTGANVTVVSDAEFSLLQAIADAQEGETVTLTDDITTSDIITIDKAITLDGNGMTLTSDAARAINVATEGVVTTVAVITYAGSDYYHGFATLAEAVEFAKAGQTITLIRDITLTENETVMIKKDINLDLNGKTVTGSNSQLYGASRAFWVHNYIGDLDSSKHSDDTIKARLNLDIFGKGNSFNITSTTVLSAIRYGFNTTVFINPETGEVLN